MPRTPRRIIGSIVRRVLGTAHRIEYAPEGWATRLPHDASSQAYWARFIARERAACEKLIERVRAGESLAGIDPDESLKHNTFAAVLRAAALQTPRLTLLDVGGNLGDYYWLAKAFAPGVELEFHCKELPAIAEAGRQINPSVTFHTDDDCLDRSYDLVMFSSSLQYVPHWQDTLAHAARAARSLFLSDVPTVTGVPSFVVTERSDGVANLHHHLNRSEILSTVERAGLRVVREFDMGAHPPVANAPEQPRCCGWLFRQRK